MIDLVCRYLAKIIPKDFWTLKAKNQEQGLHYSQILNSFKFSIIRFIAFYQKIFFTRPLVLKIFKLEGVYMRFHFEIISIRHLDNFLYMFTGNTPKWNSLRVLSHCGPFDRNEISFWVINVSSALPRNEIIRKETYAHANIS